MDGLYEKAAIAATLPECELLFRVKTVIGEEIGDPVNNNSDSATICKKLGFEIKYLPHSAWCVGNKVEACCPYNNDKTLMGKYKSARMATLYAAAALYERH